MLSLILHVFSLDIFIIYHCCVDHRCHSIMANYSSDHGKNDVEFEIATNYVFRCIQYVQNYCIKSHRCTSILSKSSFMDEINEGNCQVCYEIFCMDIQIFHHLCNELKMLHLLEENIRIVLVEEVVAMFVCIVGHSTDIRLAAKYFQHSTETIQPRFRCILWAIRSLGSMIIRPNNNANKLPDNLHEGADVTRINTNNLIYMWRAEIEGKR